MSDPLRQLAILIRAELMEVERILLRLIEGWQRYQSRQSNKGAAHTATGRERGLHCLQAGNPRSLPVALLIQRLAWNG